MSSSRKLWSSRKVSNFRLKVTLRLAPSWMRWHLRQTSWRLNKAEKRLLLLQLAMDRQHLLVKAHQQKLDQLYQQHSEQTESLQHRTQGSLLPTLSLTPQEEIALRSGPRPQQISPRNSVN